MNTTSIEFDRAEAQEAYKLYRQHRGAHTKEDAEISRIYYQIAKGRKVIRAHESIRLAGVDALGRPKLALIRADIQRCRLIQFSNHVVFADAANQWRKTTRMRIDWSSRAYTNGNNYDALVPLIPVHLRPSDALEKYHILWEADWTKVPVDPMLLKRLSGDAWLVVAAWDLTAVEQAVLAGRL